MIIGLTGRAGSGKSTAAKVLKRGSDQPWFRIRFAGPLKAMLFAYLKSVGVDRQTAYRMIEGDLKEVPTGALSGASPRHAMQTLGTEWGRDKMHPGFWVHAWKLAALAKIERGFNVVVEDVRFENEAAAIRELGGFICLIKRPEAGRIVSHAHISESGVEHDTAIWNDGPVDILRERLRGVVGRRIHATAA